MSIPPHHDLGDTGHTTDHNSIIDTLNDHESDLANLGLEIGNLGATYVSKAGQNTVTVASPAGYDTLTVIPPGARNSDAYVRRTTYGGRETFALDSYGQVRIGSAIDTTAPLEVYGPSGQTGSLTVWRKGGVTGTAVASMDANGNLIAANVTPTAWANISLAGGLSTANGTLCQYRAIGDMVYLRGQVRKTDNSTFHTSPTTMGTLPSGFRPPYIVYTSQGSHQSGNYLSVRMEISNSGGMVINFPHGSYQPSWASFDGISFSRTL